MQLNQNTISKFGLGQPEASPPDPYTHMPSAGVGSNILYSNNPSSTAVYNPNAGEGYMKDINSGVDINPNGSNVFSHKSPNQIATAKSRSSSGSRSTSPFLNTGTTRNSFTATTPTTSAPPRVIRSTSSGATTGLVRSNTTGVSTKKPSITNTAGRQLAVAAKPTINNLFSTINKILGNIIGRR